MTEEAENDNRKSNEERIAANSKHLPLYGTQNQFEQKGEDCRSVFKKSNYML